MAIRPALVLGFVGFITSFGAHIVAVNLPFYAARVGIGTAMIGLLIASYDFAEIVGKPSCGALSDHWGMKRTMLAGVVVFSLASALYLMVSPRLLLLIRFLQGIGAAGLSAVSLALIGVYYAENRGTAYGIYNAIKGSGYIVSPLIGGLIVLRSSFASLFIATAAVGVVAFLLCLTLPHINNQDSVGELADDDDLSFKSLSGLFRDPLLAKWYAVIVLNMFFVSTLFGFIPVYIHTLGYNAMKSGIILSVIALSYLLVQPFAGKWADLTNATRTVYTGLLVSAVGLILAPFLKGISLVAVAVASAAGVGVVWTNSDTIVSRLAKASRLGATMGAAGSFKEFGDMVGPLLIGSLSQLFGLRIGFMLCGLAGLAVLFLLARTARAPNCDA
jgi:MFS family permease